MARAWLEVKIFGGEFAVRSSLKTSQTSVINVAAAVMAAAKIRALIGCGSQSYDDECASKVNSHTKSSALYLQGETCRGMYIVLHGVVALSTGIGSNRQVRVASRREGSVLGLAETIGGGSYQTTALAATDVTTQFIAKTDVLNAIADDPTTGLQFLQMLTADLSDLYGRIKAIVAARVHR